MAIRYRYRPISPEEFSRLLKESTLSLDDFLYLTGRRRDVMEHFLAGTRHDFTPTMGDVLIVELAKLDKEGIDDMFELVGRHFEGKGKRRSAA